jgi:vacuolar-type H+-ATPase subunit H
VCAFDYKRSPLSGRSIMVGAVTRRIGPRFSRLPGPTGALMEVREKLDDIVRYVESARSVPMSTSAMVNRAELLQMLGELAELLPARLADAEKVFAERRELLDEARAESERLLADARRRQAELLTDHEIVRAAQAEADRLLSDAHEKSNEIRHEAEDYADVRLANVEVVLDRLLTAVRGGREHLAQLAGSHAETLGHWRLPADDHTEP